MGTLNFGKVALALLGILAYKNRDKLGELIKGQPADPNNPDSQGGLAGGLRDVLDKFRNAGAGEHVDSWVRDGPNQPIDPDHVEKAIDPEILDQLSRQTGLSHEELLDRLSKDLPEAVDKATPNGRLPSDDQVAALEPTLLDDVSTPVTTLATGPKI
jgi:uncharacterized protein YidB (DUF937 family)